MHEYTDENRHESTIAGFKKPFGAIAGDVDSSIGIIIVQSMLLTGFDAPVEQVMYLDNVVKEHNLLQAIARVNRIEKNKHAGFIIDYVGIVNHLRKALSSFEARDVDDVLEVFKDEAKDIDELVYAKKELEEFFKKFDVSDPNDVDACIDVLADEEARNDFLALFRRFSKAIDRVLPKPDALPFIRDLKHYSFISQSARNRYRDEKFSIRDASKKVRDIVDEFLISKGINPKIPPLPIFSEEFKVKLDKTKSSKAKAEELKFAIDEYIVRHQEEDPELYERFSEKLEKLLQEYRANWDQLALELGSLLNELKEGRSIDDSYGLDPHVETPFLWLLKKEIYGRIHVDELGDDKFDLLVTATKDIVSAAQREVQLVDFWNNYPAQKRLKGHIASRLLMTFRGDETILRNRNALAQKLLELAFHLDQKIRGLNVAN